MAFNDYITTAIFVVAIIAIWFLVIWVCVEIFYAFIKWLTKKGILK